MKLERNNTVSQNNLNALKLFFTLIFSICCLAFSPVIAQEQSESNPPEEYIYDNVNQLKIYGFRPADFDANKTYPAIVIFHGGGWSIGEASWGFGTAQHYADLGMVAFSVQYRLQTDDNDNTPYESVLDAQTAIRWLRENADKFSVNPEMIAAYGWSAGAHIAACAAVFENLNAPETTVSSSPNLLLLKSPALSLLLYRNFQTRLHDDVMVKDISPAEAVDQNMPPSLIVIGRDDTVTPLSGSLLYKDNMAKHGNECELIIYEGVGHLFTPSSEPDDGWPNPDEKVRQDAQDKMDAFLKMHQYITKK